MLRVAKGAGTMEAQTVLERFVDTPEGRVHPGILHLYVHLMEMSPTPEKTSPSPISFPRNPAILKKANTARLQIGTAFTR